MAGLILKIGSTYVRRDGSLDTLTHSYPCGNRTSFTGKRDSYWNNGRCNANKETSKDIVSEWNDVKYPWGDEPKVRKVYLIGSLRNIQVTRVAALLRDAGFEVFDDWFAAGPTADDAWKEYEQARGRTYKEAMEGYAAKHVFEFDKKHIDEADIGVLLLPAGKSAHAELGYMKGKGKKCIVYLESDAERWDIMYNFFDSLVYTDDELIGAVNAQ